jgi:hypothetical protein
MRSTTPPPALPPVLVSLAAYAQPPHSLCRDLAGGALLNGQPVSLSRLVQLTQQSECGQQALAACCTSTQLHPSCVCFCCHPDHLGNSSAFWGHLSFSLNSP